LKTKTQSVCDEEDTEVSRKLQCTNLIFFSHLVNSLSNYEDVSSISTVRKHGDLAAKIDIVANDNQTWVKIIARKSESIIDEALGRCEYGSKSILQIADEFMQVAAAQLNYFRPPKVVFDFLNPLDKTLEKRLESKGIQMGHKFMLPPTVTSATFTKLNVDVSTMIAYVSELTNGGENCVFDEKLLNEQALMERKNPVKPSLEKVFEGKELISCETAVKSFCEIIDLLAGPKEKQRAEELKERLTILPDIDEPERVINLELSAQIKERARKIFAFGIFHKAISISSNAGFCRSAKMKNFHVPMITHEARALTEKKELCKGSGQS
jgi:Protein of unknown function (DUF1308)/Family of unknown function (DUF5614)